MADPPAITSLIIRPPRPFRSPPGAALGNALLCSVPRATPEDHRFARYGGVRPRMALHAGEVCYDAYGAAGGAISHACRLIEASVLKPR